MSARESVSLKAEVKSLFRFLRRIPDQLLRPVRRRGAITRVSQLLPSSVLFVCHGNVCRSPYAAAFFSRELPEFLRPIQVTSAGFIGPGRTAPPQALAEAERRGLDLSPHRSTLISRQRARAASLIVVMSAAQARSIRRAGVPRSRVVVLGDFDPNPTTDRTIVDPWGGSDQIFSESYERIERCLRELVRVMVQSKTRVLKP